MWLLKNDMKPEDGQYPNMKIFTFGHKISNLNHVLCTLNSERITFLIYSTLKPSSKWNKWVFPGKSTSLNCNEM